MNKNDICIINPRLAKELIHNGGRVINIKPNRDNTDMTVFYFERTKEIEKYLWNNHTIKA